MSGNKILITDELANVLGELKLNKQNVLRTINDTIIFDNGYKLQDLGYEWAYYKTSTEIPQYLKKD
jgi:hypothetical protein